MEIITHLIVAGVISIVTTIVSMKVLFAEIKKDVSMLKTQIREVKEDKEKDIDELKLMMKENNSERKESLSKMEQHIEKIFETLTAIQIQIAKNS